MATQPKLPSHHDPIKLARIATTVALTALVAATAGLIVVSGSILDSLAPGGLHIGLLEASTVAGAVALIFRKSLLRGLISLDTRFTRQASYMAYVAAARAPVAVKAPVRSGAKRHKDKRKAA